MAIHLAQSVAQPHVRSIEYTAERLGLAAFMRAGLATSPMIST